MIFFYFPGNLALSRALGDFVFKRNSKKSPEEQIVTGKFLFYNTNVWSARKPLAPHSIV